VIYAQKNLGEVKVITFETGDTSFMPKGNREEKSQVTIIDRAKSAREDAARLTKKTKQRPPRDGTVGPSGVLKYGKLRTSRKGGGGGRKDHSRKGR